MFFSILLAAGCREDNRLGRARNIDPTGMPQLSTRNVSTLISDSGYTKYKVVTPLWKIYGADTEAGKETYWDFPEGVYLRQLDHQLAVVSTVAADSAVYFPTRKLWELYGDVEIDQKDKAYFFSERIFFDDRQRRIYSDTLIYIKTPTQTLEGIGFESNQDLTKYRVLKPTGTFPTKQFDAEDSNGGEQPESPRSSMPHRELARDPMPNV